MLFRSHDMAAAFVKEDPNAECRADCKKVHRRLHAQTLCAKRTRNLQATKRSEASNSCLAAFNRGVTDECFDSCVAAANGASGVDHLWRRRLQAAIDETERAASLEDALRPLVARFAGEIDAGDLRAAVDGQREEWRVLLYSPEGGFNLPKSYKLDWAIAIYVYTLADPAIFRIVNREMYNPERRKPGAERDSVVMVQLGITASERGGDYDATRLEEAFAMFVAEIGRASCRERV